jgi:hypothetical protein
MKDDVSEWWPSHVRIMFSAIGKAMDGRRLDPETLNRMPNAFGGILQGHHVTVQRVSEKELGRRKGHYVVTVGGPLYAGQWRFLSSDLEKLARTAVQDLGSRQI